MGPFPPIDLQAFSWEAFATLVTGALAVAAAYLVGRRQVQISARQASILERQTDLEDLRTRIDVFERRFEIYEATRQIIAKALLEPAYPDIPTDNAFFAAKDRARFLFKPEVREKLDAIWRDIDGLRTAEKMAGVEGRSDERMQSYFDQHDRHMEALGDWICNLGDVFGDELFIRGLGASGTER